VPKYIPNKDEDYKITPCPVCGQDTFDHETCSNLCDQHWEIFKADIESAMMEDALNN
jgi:hypothetical protein